MEVSIRGFCTCHARYHVGSVDVGDSVGVGSYWLVWFCLCSFTIEKGILIGIIVVQDCVILIGGEIVIWNVFIMCVILFISVEMFCWARLLWLTLAITGYGGYLSRWLVS